MDTREKIIPVDQLMDATAEGDWLVVASSFDPLTAANAAALARQAAAEPGRRLAAFVISGESLYLSPEARAALIASLRCVHLVVHGELASLPKGNDRIRVICDPVADSEHSEQFAQLIVGRQKAGS